MAATFGSSAAPVVVDETASQDTGAVSTGIGVTGADGAAVATQRIGGAAFNLTVETDANLATPE
jgi:hypothetical protein